jgi:predicted dehydrogenase
VPVEAPNKGEARSLLAEHFAACVRTGEPPISDAVSGLVNNTIIDAIYQSAKTGRSVDLDWSFLDS